MGIFATKHQLARTKPLFRRATRLKDLNDSGAERFDRRCVVGKDTHITSRRRKVHLHDIGRSEDSLQSAVKTAS